MNILRYTIYKIQLPMVFLVSLWIALGRSLFGAGGWLFLITIFVLGPLVFAVLLTNFLLTIFQKDVRAAKRVAPLDVGVLSASYLLFFTAGFVVEDGGDTPESVGSAYSKLFNVESTVLHQNIAWFSFVIALGLMAGLIVFNIYRIFEGRQNAKTQQIK